MKRTEKEMETIRRILHGVPAEQIIFRGNHFDEQLDISTSIAKHLRKMQNKVPVK